MKGKEKCEILKGIRRQVADEYQLEYEEKECHHEGDCSGTCPQCEQELSQLQRQLDEKGFHQLQLDNGNPQADDQNPHPENTRVEKGKDDTDVHFPDDTFVLQGDVSSGSGPEETIQITEGLPYPPNEIPAGMPAPTEKRKVFYKECPIAGWSFHIDKETYYELEEGTPLVLIRDRNNRNDPNAVAVALADDYDEDDPEDFDMDYIIGYVPRTENAQLAVLMDLGWTDLFTAELTTVKHHGKAADRLRMTLYFQSKTEENIDHSPQDKIFAVRIDQEELETLTTSLDLKGSVYYRWGGFPVWQRTLPKKGNHVLLLHTTHKDAILYLMHLIATDNEAAPFLENPEEELNYVDDCSAYILTNIMGPLRIPLSALDFLDLESIPTHQPNGYLASWVTERLLELFDEA